MAETSPARSLRSAARRILCAVPSGRSKLDGISPCLGALLVLSAALKAHEVATAESLSLSAGTMAWTAVRLVVAAFELMFGFLLAFKSFQWLTRPMLPIVFAAMAIVALRHAANGDSSCGCFGVFAVSPWLMFALDTTLVVVLCVRFEYGRRASGAVSQNHRPPWLTRRCWLPVLFGIAGICVLFARGFWASGLDRALPGSHLASIGTSADWFGRRFPLLDYIDHGEQMAKSHWFVLFHRHGCPRCRRTLSCYGRLVDARLAGRAPAPKVALIEVRPTGHNDHSGTPVTPKQWVKAALNEPGDWNTEAPFEVELQDGKVVGVLKSADLEALSGILSAESTPISLWPKQRRNYLETQL